MLKEKTMIELSKIIIANDSRFAKLNLRENMLKDSGIKILADALGRNSSIIHLDIC